MVFLNQMRVRFTARMLLLGMFCSRSNMSGKNIRVNGKCRCTITEAGVTATSRQLWAAPNLVKRFRFEHRGPGVPIVKSHDQRVIGRDLSDRFYDLFGLSSPLPRVEIVRFVPDLKEYPRKDERNPLENTVCSSQNLWDQCLHLTWIY